MTTPDPQAVALTDWIVNHGPECAEDIEKAVATALAKAKAAGFVEGRKKGLKQAAAAHGCKTCAQAAQGEE